MAYMDVVEKNDIELILRRSPSVRSWAVSVGKLIELFALLINKKEEVLLIIISVQAFSLLESHWHFFDAMLTKIPIGF